MSLSKKYDKGKNVENVTNQFDKSFVLQIVDFFLTAQNLAKFLQHARIKNELNNCRHNEKHEDVWLSLIYSCLDLSAVTIASLDTDSNKIGYLTSCLTGCLACCLKVSELKSFSSCTREGPSIGEEVESEGSLRR